MSARGAVGAGLLLEIEPEKIDLEDKMNKLKKSVARLTGVLLIAAFSAPLAMADLVDLTTYSINFTGTGLLPTAGMFTYDPDTTTFTSFLVTWDGLQFNLSSEANAPAKGRLAFSTSTLL